MQRGPAPNQQPPSTGVPNAGSQQQLPTPGIQQAQQQHVGRGAGVVQHQAVRPGTAQSTPFPNLLQAMSGLSAVNSAQQPGIAQTGQLVYQRPPAYTTPVPAAQHLGQSPAGVGTNPTLVNPQPIQTISTQSQQRTSVGTNGNSAFLLPGITSLEDANLTVAEQRSSMDSPVPRKKIKLEEQPPATEEIGLLRKQICDTMLTDMKKIKDIYTENLTELFFLQSGGNYVDFHAWLKKPSPQLTYFLNSDKLDSDDEENKETKLPSAPGGLSLSNLVPFPAQPVKPEPLQPPAAQLGSTVPSIVQQAPALAKAMTENIGISNIKTGTSGAGTPSVQTPKPPKTPLSPTRLATRQHSISAVYDSTIGSQEAIVERAKQEAQVMQRIADLRKEGLWSSKRLPKVQEMPRNKAHWDYLLEEMQWLAADFAQERKWKKAACRKIASMVSRYHKEQELKAQKAEKEESLRLVRIANSLAKQVKEFWANIEKVVQYKQTSRLEEKRKKALDLHLNFIVDQTEKYSSWLSQGLTTKSTTSSVQGSIVSSPEHSQDDDDFQPDKDESDDEETIEQAEAEGMDDESTQQEIEALQKESELPIEDLIKTLHPEYLETPAGSSTMGSDVEADDEGADEEFKSAEEDEVDDEDTIEEQEKAEKKDYKGELQDLKDEGEMSIEELAKKYAGAYDSDFEMPESSDEGETSTEEESESTEEEEASDASEELEDVGMEYLIHPENKPEDIQAGGDSTETKGPGKEITDIAAAAQSLQPTGYTLETTQVKVPVPFLLKHSLREYQYVGLDWLATMYEKKLNGILADEMGLGKTIQTIALLAHLACEKGVWGPHLIVVPTSVMLNWEMELKKWCPAFKILTYYGNQKERKQKRQGWTKTNAFHVCITSYKLVIQDHQAFRRKKWKYFILDEAQNIKNFKSQRWQTLLNFSSQRRLLLTGTPLQNNLMELWSLMHFLMPHVFQSHREFKEWFANPLSGMIEGSQEYNENLIRRLHKVLRPFLLRRLKADVEKQMPKKYEHVVMCRLSKRQRFLYDDFMAQAKTKEMLASGHFMSVINILMQLRKVCNHPNLFDPRPIMSPFQTEGITYQTASAVLRALDYDPFKHVNLQALSPSLATLELSLPAYAAHRVKKLQTPKPLIVEIDSQPEPVPRPKPFKLKDFVLRSASPSVQSGRLSPFAPIQQRSASPLPGKSPLTRSPASTPTPLQVRIQGSPSPSLIVPTSINTTQPEQLPGYTGPARASTPGQGLLLASSTQSLSTGQLGSQSQPITVQIHHTQQGTRLLIPSSQLTQLPAGFLQIVQSSTGQHILTTAATSQGTPVQAVAPVQTTTTTTAASASPVPSTTVVRAASPAASVVTVRSASPATSAAGVRAGSPAVSITGTAVRAASPATSASAATVTLMNGLPPVSTPTTPVSTPKSTLPVSSSVVVTPKPVVRVSPMSVESAAVSASSSQPAASTPSKSVIGTRSQRKSLEKAKEAPEKSPFYLESLAQKRAEHRQEKLERIAKINARHCDWKPVYGQDLCAAVDVLSGLKSTTVLDNTMRGLGYVNCYHAQHRSKLYNPEMYYRWTQPLMDIVHTPEKYVEEMKDILERYCFLIPPVKAPEITMHASHPPPSLLTERRTRYFTLQTALSPKAMCLHKMATNMMVWFPEPRLIQYDCGKLQTLAVLLRRLKSEGHKVLIFTQMTKMLDVLEVFLSYHGHRYLRLDGTTRVEMRQALMERFNMDKRIFAFILSTRSGGLGMNLTGADTVIFYDSDWNPTMDAQAQDRCHRIGQTRDVHIYRLISEKTVEENILKKASQKRLLGDVAIEGGNFTTAFFRQNTIQELFEEPSGLDSLVKEKAEKAAAQQAVKTTQPAPELSESQLEQALCDAEDETDVQAAKIVHAEQKAELAEFDETIPWDETEAARREEESKVEKELSMLENELMSVERYAVKFVESQIEPFNVEELKQAEDAIDSAKKDWELNRLKALKEEEERRLEIEEDEMLFTYSRDDACNQVKRKKKTAKVASKDREDVSKVKDGELNGSKPLRLPTRHSSRAASRASTPNQSEAAGGGGSKNRASKDCKGSSSKSEESESIGSPRTRSRPGSVDNEANKTPLRIVIPKQSPRSNSAVTSPKQGTKSKLLSPRSSSSNSTPKVSPRSTPKSSPKSNMSSPKEIVVPVSWSNPNLVIRTRRASAQTRFRQDSESSEVDVVSVCTDTTPSLLRPTPPVIGARKVVKLSHSAPQLQLSNSLAEVQEVLNHVAEVKESPPSIKRPLLTHPVCPELNNIPDNTEVVHTNNGGPLHISTASETELGNQDSSALSPQKMLTERHWTDALNFS
ncbi:helicase SRCAP [Lingula anatina]|uniref:Helicase SRCAP n=1 Tax=Lingula anatina TaxID=7574 RepID=A0A1S3H104_LINAN|nr:helicase SRCAP [Lingula anatina]|eukprot:XP_013379688.1 helicase SRCAP [Lingula anatina]